MEKQEMNKGVQILLERMDSNPDEFVPDLLGGYPAKWRNTLMAVQMRTTGGKEYKDQLAFLSDTEVAALWTKMQSVLGNRFTQDVMRTLLHDKELSSLSFNQQTRALQGNSLKVVRKKAVLNTTKFGKLYTYS